MAPVATPAQEHPFVLRPHRTLLALSLPVLLSLIAEPLTGLADTAFVARLGAAPLAALGVGTVLLSSVYWIFNFLGIGTQTEVARAAGAGHRDRAAEVTGLGMLLALLFGTILMAGGGPLADDLAAAMGARQDVHEGAVTYIRIRLLGLPAILLTTVAFGSLRGLLDMRTPLRIAVSINALNILLDAVLIFGLGPIPALGIAGAAWATVASHWLGAVWGLLAVRARVGLPSRLRARDARLLLVAGRDLRNVMLAATGLGVADLALLDESAPGALTRVWLITGGWIGVRAAFGMVRIWPGIGSSPFRN